MISALGGGVFGYILGWIAFKSLAAVDEARIETMITLALVMGGYSLAGHLGVSSVVAMAVAGVVVAKFGAPSGMTPRSRAYVLGFWETIEEILNSILFLLIGLEVIVVAGSSGAIWLGIVAIPLVLVARATSVGIPMLTVSLFWKVDKHPFGIFVWGGLRGGIPIALSLSLPRMVYSEIFGDHNLFRGRLFRHRAGKHA